MLIEVAFGEVVRIFRAATSS